MTLQQPRTARAVQATLAACALCLILLTAAYAQTDKPAPPKSVAPAAFAGTWEGKFHSLPYITLNIKADGDKLSGTVVFFRIVNKGDGEQMDGQVEVPMTEPKFDGTTLVFQIKPPGADAKAFGMELKLTSANEGVVTKTHSADEDEGMTIKVVRKQ
jgi:hypothetical protein